MNQPTTTTQHPDIIAISLRLAFEQPSKVVAVFTDHDGQTFIGYEGEELQPITSY